MRRKQTALKMYLNQIRPLTPKKMAEKQGEQIGELKDWALSTTDGRGAP